MNLYFSHGFGVWSDDDGMFTDIAKRFPTSHVQYAEYNDRNEHAEMVVSPFSEQVKRLEKLVSYARPSDVLIAHSQGCIVAALADLPRFSHVIFITPPPYTSLENFMARIARRNGTKTPDGLWSFPSSRGSTRWIPQRYLDELETTDVLPMYQRIAAKQNLTIIQALDDEILLDTDVSSVRGAAIIKLRGDHNFTGSSRERLLSALSDVTA